MEKRAESRLHGRPHASLIYILKINFAVRFNLLAGLYNFFHDFVKTVIICIDLHFLHHEVDVYVIYTIQILHRILHLCCTVCTVYLDFEFLLHFKVPFRRLYAGLL